MPGILEKLGVKSRKMHRVTSLPDAPDYQSYSELATMGSGDKIL